jgi:hypothetical protein
MWDLLLEWCADSFGVTMRGRLGQLFLSCSVLSILGLLLVNRWGMLGWIPPALLLVLAAVTAHEVSSARNAVWKAACMPLDEPQQLPDSGAERRLLPPTAIALHRLAAAVNDVRRGSYTEANDRIPSIDRSLLRPEEAQLLDAARAMVSLGLGDSRRAAQQAAVALPTGSVDLDVCLGRAMIADAWNVPERLRAIDHAWERAGIAHDPGGILSRLQKLARIRVDARLLEQIQALEARELSNEARAIGDDDLAADLDARAHPRPYR